jgi:hypothetical protein
VAAPPAAPGGALSGVIPTPSEIPPSTSPPQWGQRWGSASPFEAAELMEKHADTPMEFADATLVLMAEALELKDVFTLDRRGFSAYGTRDGRP